ncbi:hypothetical protein [Colibacter massiliensis]|uniref:hypothetical protein n=1 Tax=Colibacter massiliensis TaxID=1852379 RepID=UPI00094F20BA|nr:hypothetical protein [Colibacter massiliensis]
MTIEDVRTIISLALDELYEKDQYLILNNGNEENHLSERSIVSKYSIYINEIVKKELPSFNVDTEYNRNINDKKETRSRSNGSCTDLIVHKRGRKDQNLIVMEFKPWWNSKQEDDKKKIEDYCDEDEYKYKYGVLILLGKTRNDADIKIYHEGQWESMKKSL